MPCPSTLEANGIFALHTPLSAATAAATLALTSCSFDQSSEVDIAAERKLTRSIEIEVGDLERGLPCSVIDRRAPDARNVLWHAEFEEGFCHRKAEETRQILQARGWACRLESADERREPTVHPANPPFVVAAWRCLDGLKPVQRLNAHRPPVPTARPVPHRNPALSWGSEALRAAVAQDLSTIGQDEIGAETIMGAALGDLDSDGIEDAIVLLTREATSGPPHRMLMAYLQNGEAYNLVDVWILKMSDNREGDKLDLTIKDGAVHLGDCCRGETGPTVLVLDNRKLAHADDG